MAIILKRDAAGLCRCPDGSLSICSACDCDLDYTGDVWLYINSGDFGFNRLVPHTGDQNWHLEFDFAYRTTTWSTNATCNNVGSCQWEWTVTITKSVSGTPVGSMTYYSAVPGCWEVSGYLTSDDTPPAGFVSAASIDVTRPAI